MGYRHIGTGAGISKGRQSGHRYGKRQNPTGRIRLMPNAKLDGPDLSSTLKTTPARDFPPKKATSSFRERNKHRDVLERETEILLSLKLDAETLLGFIVLRRTENKDCSFIVVRVWSDPSVRPGPHFQVGDVLLPISLLYACFVWFVDLGVLGFVKLCFFGLILVHAYWVFDVEVLWTVCYLIWFDEVSSVWLIRENGRRQRKNGVFEVLAVSVNLLLLLKWVWYQMEDIAWIWSFGIK